MNAERKLLHVLMVGQTPPPIGGVGEQIRLLLNSPLKNAVCLNHISPERGKDCRGVERVLGSIKLCYRLLRYRVIKRPDIIHLHTSSYRGFYEKALLIQLLRLMHQPVVLHVHGGGFRDFYCSSWFKKFISNTLESADIVLALSARWQAFLNQVAPNARIEVFPNSVDTTEYHPLSQNQGRSAPLRVLFIGWIVRSKGVFDLLKVAEQFRGDEINFDILGDGVDMSKLREAVNQSGLVDQFILHGWKTDNEKIAFFRRASIFVLPSYIEGLPVVVLEAMAAGLPVVASDVGAITEIITPDRGIICKPGDIEAFVSALKYLMKNDGICQNMGKKSMAYVRQHHDIKINAERLVEIYEGMVKP